MDKRDLIGVFLREHHTGEERAVHSRELAALFSLSERALRRCINLLRKEEVPICSSRNGYFYANDQNDIKKCALMLGNLSEGVNGTRMRMLSLRAPETFEKYVIVIIGGHKS